MALLAASLWALNPHGIGGAILWISGRTALLLVMFSLLAAVSTLRGWHWAAAVFCLAAMLSKEEAVVLPLILTVWAGTRSFRSAATLTLPVVLYFALRSGTAAYLPHTAPEYYQPTLAPAVLARNVLEYADRSGTLAAVVVILVMAALRRRPRLDDRERHWLRLGIVWIAAALLVPLHRSRNVRMVKTAELSTQVLGDLPGAAEDIAAGKVLVLHDAVGARYNIETTFGTLIQDAVRLRTGIPDAKVWVDPPLGYWEGAGLKAPAGQSAVHYWLREGRLVAADGRAP